ncbi:HpcH/HpaI aldolase/citrate lyase family protein [Trueperella sp. LYQ143]|uniref:HpcH/HpaI aldolase/citrate lyase family protein n=1 Tax=Trueperella sp. LYQ143 TaxID=3391059 RepID=UPI0039835057
MVAPMRDEYVHAVPLTWLYVPGDRPDRIIKALATKADRVIVDLEDAVAPQKKAEARKNLHLLSEHPDRPTEIRINAINSPWFDDDCMVVQQLSHVSVRVPKVESPDQVCLLGEKLPGKSLTLLIESAIGVENAYLLAQASPSVESLGLGEADLRSDLGVSDPAGLSWVRSRIVVASRAAGLRSPAMSVYPNVRDLDGLALSCAQGRDLGFVGRAAIHPKQLETIRRAFQATAEERERAQRIIGSVAGAAQQGSGTFVLEDGTFLDVAMVEEARRVLGRV